MIKKALMNALEKLLSQIPIVSRIYELYTFSERWDNEKYPKAYKNTREIKY